MPSTILRTDNSANMSGIKPAISAGQPEQVFHYKYVIVIEMIISYSVKEKPKALICKSIIVPILTSYLFSIGISRNSESSSVLSFFSTNVSNTVPSHVFTGISRTRNGVAPLNARTEHLIITRTSTVTNLMKRLEYVPMETSKLFIFYYLGESIAMEVKKKSY